jgi:hypothetical protein
MAAGTQTTRPADPVLGGRLHRQQSAARRVARPDALPRRPPGSADSLSWRCTQRVPKPAVKERSPCPSALASIGSFSLVGEKVADRPDEGAFARVGPHPPADHSDKPSGLSRRTRPLSPSPPPSPAAPRALLTERHLAGEGAHTRLRRALSTAHRFPRALAPIGSFSPGGEKVPTGRMRGLSRGSAHNLPRITRTNLQVCPHAPAPFALTPPSPAATRALLTERRLAGEGARPTSAQVAPVGHKWWRLVLRHVVTNWVGRLLVDPSARSQGHSLFVDRL